MKRLLSQIRFSPAISPGARTGRLLSQRSDNWGLRPSSSLNDDDSRLGLSLEDWKKGVYSHVLDKRLNSMNWDDQQPFLLDLHEKLLEKFARLGKQEKLYIGSGDENIRTMKQVLLWRREVILQAVFERQDYEDCQEEFKGRMSILNRAFQFLGLK